MEKGRRRRKGGVNNRLLTSIIVATNTGGRCGKQRLDLDSDLIRVSQELQKETGNKFTSDTDVHEWQAAWHVIILKT